MIAQIFAELEATTKRTEKLAILERNKDNEELKAILVAALDPYVTYHIKKIPDLDAVEVPFNMPLSQYVESLVNLSSRNVTGHDGIAYLKSLLETLTPENAVIGARIIKKDLRCGVQGSTVNKVWPELIPVYPCLLAKAYDEKSIKEVVYPAFSQTKADGMRCNVHYNHTEQTVVFRGRSGKFVDLLGMLDVPFLELCANFHGSCMVDGELVVLEKDGTVMPRKKGNGLLNKAIKGTMTKDIASRVRMRVWDIVPAAKFDIFKDTTFYSVRYHTLEQMVELAPSYAYELIETKLVSSFDEAWAHYEEMIAAGQEGTMLKNLNHVWENKRSKDLVKLKAEEECDLEVISWNPGTPGTKNEHKMGSLVCASSDRMVVVSISGFDDALRDEITANIDAWMGQIVTVKYNERISTKDKSRGGVDSLFLPRFEELRLDKTVADHSSTIK